MTKILDVYLNETYVGAYQQDRQGKKFFSYDPEYITAADAIPLSNALPLQTTAFDDQACHCFFGGILPEATQRDLIARIFGVSAANDFSLLEKIGRECAGSVSLYPHGENPDFSAKDYKVLTDEELALRIDELPTHPLLLGYDDLRLSLAGVQDKITLVKNANKIYLPLHGSPSTHILKPEIGYTPSTVINEGFCMQLAKSLGLNVADCEIARVNDKQYLMITRYDRSGNYPNIARIHQEDFCQALGIRAENKYQNEGGPALQDCFNLVRKISSNPVQDLGSLLDAVIFNYIIGNCDAHGKNFSFVYKNQKNIRLAPFYDLLSTVVYEKLSTKMAMKIGGEYNINKIGKSHFAELAQTTDLNANMVLQRAKELSMRILYNITTFDTLQRSQDLAYLQKAIKERAEHISRW